MEQNLYNKILLVVEGGALDRDVTDAATALAMANRASLIVMHIVDHMIINRMKRVTEQSNAEIEIELEEKGWKALYCAEEFAKDHSVPTLIMQKSGVVENEVLNEAARLKVDLIIVGHPRKVSGQPKRLAQGRLEKIVENAQCSVLVVK